MNEPYDPRVKITIETAQGVVTVEGLEVGSRGEPILRIDPVPRGAVLPLGGVIEPPRDFDVRIGLRLAPIADQPIAHFSAAEARA